MLSSLNALPNSGSFPQLWHIRQLEACRARYNAMIKSIMRKLKPLSYVPKVVTAKNANRFLTATATTSVRNLPSTWKSLVYIVQHSPGLMKDFVTSWKATHYRTLNCKRKIQKTNSPNYCISIFQSYEIAKWVWHILC